VALKENHGLGSSLGGLHSGVTIPLLTTRTSRLCSHQ